MSVRVISTYQDDNSGGKADVCFSPKDEEFFIEYYDADGHKYFTEDFPNIKLSDVEQAAEDWTLGHRKLEDF